MSKKNRNKSPRPSDLLGKTTPPEPTEEAEAPTKDIDAGEFAETPAEIPPPEVKEASTLEQMVANLPPELREKAQAELDKLVTQAKRNEATKQWVGFDTALKDEGKGLPKFVGDLAKEYGVDLTSRRITITYPDGKFAYTNSPKGSKGNGNSGRKGFPTGWGEAELVKKGEVVQKETSPSKLAETLGLQVEGMRNMPDVFENPHERGTKAELPKIYSVDAERGDHFRVIIKS